MAQNQLDREKFCCSICLDLLNDPVTVPCGHSYCMKCIKTHWNKEDEERDYSCPQCRKTFTLRPVLGKNTMLADLVEERKKTGLQAAPADHCYTGPEDSICYLCSVDEHKGHDTVSAAAERTERQRELEGSRLNIQQRIQDGEKDVKLLQQEVEAINGSADKAVEYSEKMFTEMIRLMEKRRSDVKQRVRSQQETEVSRARELQEKLEQEITELKKRDAELQKLSHTEDHNQFLHDYPSLSALKGRIMMLDEFVESVRYFQGVTAAVSAVRDKLQDALKEEWTKISQTGTEVDVLLSQLEPEPKTRDEFLKYSHDITLDPNTANTQLLLSDGSRKATYMGPTQSYSGHPYRFTGHPQVLSRESLTGRCYWEVERRGIVYVAVAYKNISRAGSSIKCVFGHNDKSWALYCSNNSYNFRYNDVMTPVSGPQSSRVGVYLDHRAGILSFYSISKTMTLLHSVQTSFTQPLHAGLLIGYSSSAELWRLK
ncbi:tripartite motif-containing protein 16-like protein [Notolabrus celidotus]|uniref:tripartite motif-containing protein 16-like protein n=1 Tax=Notolabrus celidotus TaxID=1203425 RepID=UPI00148F93E0|nr:tripartite motif-containing protein 16-like protein [Notolabrus celidotus]